MKRITFTILVAGILICGLDSCKKEAFTQTPSAGREQTPVPYIMHLVADNWQRYDEGTYVNDFRGILSTVNASGSRTVKVYLVTNGATIMINHSVTTFMGNRLWATTTSSDITINYACSATKLPFTSLQIQVVIE